MWLHVDIDKCPVQDDHQLGRYVRCIAVQAITKACEFILPNGCGSKLILYYSWETPAKPFQYYPCQEGKSAWYTRLNITVKQSMPARIAAMGDEGSEPGSITMSTQHCRHLRFTGEGITTCMLELTSAFLRRSIFPVELAETPSNTSA